MCVGCTRRHSGWLQRGCRLWLGWLSAVALALVNASVHSDTVPHSDRSASPAAINLIANQHLPVSGSGADASESQSTVEVELTTGERLRGVLIEHSGSTLVLMHPVLGRLEIPATGVRAVVDPAADSAETQPTTAPEPQADADAEPEAKPSPDAPPDAPESPWSFELDIGADASYGNSENASLRTSLVAKHETLDNSTTFDIGYRLRTSEGNRTENRFTTGIVSEWPLNGSPWSTFAQGRYDHAEFQSWDHRVTAGGGFGYHLLQIHRPDPETGELTEYFDTSLRFGVGGRRDYGTVEQEDLIIEGILGAEIGWNITPRQRFSAHSTFYPALTNIGEFRVVSRADWTIDINHLDGISLNIGLEHDHESDTDPGIKKDDISAYASLKIAF